MYVCMCVFLCIKPSTIPIHTLSQRKKTFQNPFFSSCAVSKLLSF